MFGRKSITASGAEQPTVTAREGAN